MISPVLDMSFKSSILKSHAWKILIVYYKHTICLQTMHYDIYKRCLIVFEVHLFHLRLARPANLALN